MASKELTTKPHALFLKSYHNLYKESSIRDAAVLRVRFVISFHGIVYLDCTCTACVYREIF